jgi:hypothetical protein
MCANANVQGRNAGKSGNLNGYNEKSLVCWWRFEGWICSLNSLPLCSASHHTCTHAKQRVHCYFNPPRRAKEPPAQAKSGIAGLCATESCAVQSLLLFSPRRGDKDGTEANSQPRPKYPWNREAAAGLMYGQGARTKVHVRVYSQHQQHVPSKNVSTRLRYYETGYGCTQPPCNSIPETAHPGCLPKAGAHNYWSSLSTPHIILNVPCLMAREGSILIQPDASQLAAQHPPDLAPR